MRFFLPNPGFELGDVYWSSAAEFSIIRDAGNARSGAWVGEFVGNDQTREIFLPAVPVRPGSVISASIWAKGGTSGNVHVRGLWRDVNGSSFQGETGPAVASGGGYTQSADSWTAPDRAKSISLGVLFATDGGLLQGTWHVDDMDADGDIIESIPSSAVIRQHRMIPADTVGVFDPLVGQNKFSEFNAGMSDHWGGVYTFVPSVGRDLGELVSLVRRIGRTERFFAFDPDHTTPIKGPVYGLLVDGTVNGGNSRIPVRGGVAGSTPLLAGDYVEIRAQYFQLQRDLEIGPEGTGDMIVWPSVRASLADGEDVITDNPKMVAKVTSDLDWRRMEARPVDLTISWEEVV